MDVKWLVLRTLPLAGTHPSMPSFYRKRKKKEIGPELSFHSLSWMREEAGEDIMTHVALCFHFCLNSLGLYTQ